MWRRGVASVLGVAIFSVVVGAGAPAVAGPNKSECIAAFDRAQRARTDKRLRQARTDLLVCTQESCSAVLRADCSGVLQSVESALPTLVFAADDGEGHDITDVKVYNGTDVVATGIDGRAIELDPGTYDFRFERAGKSVTVRQVVKEGEKARSVRASFPSPKKPAAANAGASGTRQLGAATPRSTAGYVVPIGLGVVGILALGFAGYSRLQFDADVDDMRRRCAPECSQTERSDLSSTLVTSNVSLGIGLGALALAVVSWFVFEPASRTTTTAASTSGFPRMIGRVGQPASW